jgi:tryptophanyl-tRNA synthetase
VTQSVNDFLAPVRKRRNELLKDPAYLWAILEDGNLRANAIANATLDEVREAMGMSYHA